MKNKALLLWGCFLLLGMLNGCIRKTINNIQNVGTPPVLMLGKPLVFIMPGQSNMTGGHNEGVVTPDTPRIRYVNPTGTGPIRPFAEALIAKHPALNLVIIPCAVDGTYISQWGPGGLIEPCLAVAKIEIGKGGVMGGFVFLQGEADTKEQGQLTYNWAEAFTAIARYVRSSLGSEVPIILCRINKTTLPNFPLWQHIRDEQDSVFMTKLAHVSTDGADLIDGIHYTQSGYYLVGERMAEAAYSLLTEGN